jgi:signal transduction histidine kinase
MRKGIWSGENQIYGKNCREIPVSQVIIAHQNENGGVECYSTILRDISRQKHIEQDLLYKNNELDTFVYRASHDLRGPIASLLGLYTIVKYEITDPVSLKYFEMYNQQILRLNNIIISLIEISRIKDREASKVNINFNTIIEECITSFMNLPNFANITFKINIDPNLKFKSDLSIITTIMQNLIENSIKYSKPEVLSTVNIDIKSIVASISIKVSDNGIGIDSSIQGKIFNMFFRGTEQSMGSGLGLYILKNAVEKIKGQILLDSTLNKGTTFEIILPQ